MVYRNLRMVGYNDDTDDFGEEGEYNGMWVRDNREGKGVMRWSDGSIFEGLWKCDKRISGKMTMVDGLIYKGKF